MSLPLSAFSFVLADKEEGAPSSSSSCSRAVVFRVSGARRAVCWIDGASAGGLVEVESDALVPKALFGAHLLAPIDAVLQWLPSASSSSDADDAPTRHEQRVV